MGNLSSLSPYYRAGGGEAMGAAYRPAMMEFDGSTGYYSKSYTSSGNKFTCIARFKITTFTGGGSRFILTNDGPVQARLLLMHGASDHATADYQNTIRADVRNSAGTQVCLLISPANTYVDGEEHTVFFSYDGDAGTAIFIIDGVVADDTGNASRIAPTTGTLSTGSGSDLGVGATPVGTGHIAGTIGFSGIADSYLTNWSDFMHINGNPIKQDEATWANSGWGSQPLFWNEHGFMEDNRGSAGDMTKNGTINIADTEVVI